MDADNATTVSASIATNNKKDAVISKDSKEETNEVDKQDVTCLSDTTCGIQIQQSKDKTEEMKTNVTKTTYNQNESKEIVEEADELLEKIEEVVKSGDISSSIGGGDEDISKASEQDFLKKIDEEMKDSDDRENILSNVLKLSKEKELISNSKDKNEKPEDEKKNPIDGVIVNKEIFAIEKESNESPEDEKENPIDGVIVNKEIFAIEKESNESPENEKENQIDGVIVNKEVFAIEEENNEIDVTDKTNVNIEKENEKSQIEIHKDNSSKETKISESVSTSNVRTEESNLDSSKEKETENITNTVKEIPNQKEAQTTIDITKNQDVGKNLEDGSIKEKISTVSVPIPMKVQEQQQPSPMLIDLSKNEEPMCTDSNGNSNDKMDVDFDEKLEMDVDDENGSVLYNDEEMKSVENRVIEDMNRKVVAIENQFGKIVDGEFKESGLQIKTKDNLVNITVNVNVNAPVPNSVNSPIDKNVTSNAIEKDQKVVINVEEEKANNELRKIVDNEETLKTLETSKMTYQGTEKEAVESRKSELGKNLQSTPPKISEVQSSTDKVLSEISSTKEILERKSNTPNKGKVHEIFQKDYVIEVRNIEHKDLPAPVLQKNEDKADPVGKSESTPKKQNVSMPSEKRKEEADDVILIDDSQEKTETDNATVAPAEKLPTDDNKIENKFLSKIKGDSNVSKPGSESLTSSPLPPPQANVFNSTPIAKQFEISSENVSHISNALESSSSRCDQNLGEGTSNISESQKVQQEPGTSRMQTTTMTTTTTTSTSESGSYCPTSETDHQSSDGISKFINSIKNGMADSTTDDGSATTINSKSEVCVKEHETTATSVVGGTSSLVTGKPEENMYEINLWYEKTDIRFLSVERLERNKSAVTLDKLAGGDSSGQGSSNGSVSSLPQFSLPSQRIPSATTVTALSSSGSTSESSEKITDDRFSSHLAESNKTKHLIKGLSEVCTFMINHFTKLRTDINPDAKSTELHNKEQNELTDDENVASSGRGKKRKLATTPKPKASSSRDSTAKRGRQQQRQSQSPIGVSDSSSPVSKEGRSSKMSCESPLSIGSKVATSVDTPSSTRKSDGRGRKRSISKVISDDDDDESKPKAKQAKKTSQQQIKMEGEKQQQKQGQNENPGLCVLAKWVDKKYYAGRIVEAKPANKFVVRFEDGASKVLQKDLIVFGNEDGTLPLKDHKIHALVDDDYESGVVISIDKVDNKVLYTVKAETATVKVTASDIYLQDDVAKIIQNSQSSSTSSSSLIPGVQDLSSSGTSGLLDASTRHTRQKRISGGSPITTTASVAAAINAVSPEPGTSGGGSTTPGIGKKGKRQKRYS